MGLSSNSGADIAGGRQHGFTHHGGSDDRFHRLVGRADGELFRAIQRIDLAGAAEVVPPGGIALVYPGDALPGGDLAGFVALPDLLAAGNFRLYRRVVEEGLP